MRNALKATTSMRVYKQKVCDACGLGYTPTSPNQHRCQSCSPTIQAKNALLETEPAEKLAKAIQEFKERHELGEVSVSLDVEEETDENDADDDEQAEPLIKGIYECEFCGKKFDKHAIFSHVRRCKHNPGRDFHDNLRCMSLFLPKAIIRELDSLVNACLHANRSEAIRFYIMLGLHSAGFLKKLGEIP